MAAAEPASTTLSPVRRHRLASARRCDLLWGMASFRWMVLWALASAYGCAAGNPTTTMRVDAGSDGGADGADSGGPEAGRDTSVDVPPGTCGVLGATCCEPPEGPCARGGSGLACSGGVCVSCGRPGEPCCAAEACNAGGTCGESGLCEACGTAGARCCPGVSYNVDGCGGAVETTCAPDCGASFNSCVACPAGYAVTGYICTPGCVNPCGTMGNTAVCTRT